MALVPTGAGQVVVANEHTDRGPFDGTPLSSALAHPAGHGIRPFGFVPEGSNLNTMPRDRRRGAAGGRAAGGGGDNLEIKRPVSSIAIAEEFLPYVHCPTSNPTFLYHVQPVRLKVSHCCKLSQRSPLT
jgi:hypothetical protein